MKICKIVGCERAYWARGYCARHYALMWHNGEIISTYTLETREYHGMTNTSERKIWSDMKKRCYNPNSKFYNRYGGRGIKLYGPWRDSFIKFYTDVSLEIGQRPDKAHSLDRIDNDRDYEPGNIRWATALQQANNRGNCINIIFDGRSQTLAQWSKELNLPYPRLYSRAKKGWPPEEIFK